MTKQKTAVSGQISKDSLGDRMKMYESVSKTVLMKRTPVIIRIDGKAFHTFTKGFEKPFDSVLVEAMQRTTHYLCENIQGCVLGYTQSDEITLVLTDYKTYTTCAWFDYEVQKLCSVAASMATMIFNKTFSELVDFQIFNADTEDENMAEVIESHKAAVKKGAMFDARCFNVPLNEVTNCVLWRQQDATRNSIQSVGQHYFSHKELQNKSCDDIQEMLFVEKNVNWNMFPEHLKRGTAIVKNEQTGIWIIDENMPILTGEGRAYVESRIVFDD